MEGEQSFHDHGYNLCIFTVMPAKKRGFSLARSVRKKNATVPILFLTAKSMVEDKLEGSATCAVDYITKPFSLEELLCRIAASFRRSPLVTHLEEKIFFLGQYEFDFSNLTLKTGSS